MGGPYTLPKTDVVVPVCTPVPLANETNLLLAFYCVTARARALLVVVVVVRRVQGNRTAFHAAVVNGAHAERANAIIAPIRHDVPEPLLAQP